MKINLRIAAASLASMLLFNPAIAELYQWKDAKGKTIFSDRPPVETQKAETVDGAADKKDAAATDDPRSSLAKEEAARKRAAEKNKKLVKWRCTELEKQKAALVEQYESQIKTDANKAAATKVDIENHQTTIEKMCE